MSRSEAPTGEYVVWPRLIEYARLNNIEIDTGLSHKVEWMEKHKGVCFCDWESGRICPCGNIIDDFKKYNGQCLCGLLLTHKRLAQKEKRYKLKKDKEADENNDEKNNENKSLDSKD